MATKKETELIEKITRAKKELESLRAEHHLSCPVECDPHGVVPCNCGASEVNWAIDSALDELSL